MKALRGMSLLVLGIAVFLLLALAVYIFRSFPYLLGAVLIAELLLVAAAVIAPLLTDRIKRGWIGGVLFAMAGAALANLYMLLLAGRWGVRPAGWYDAVLHWQDGLVSFLGGILGWVVTFLDSVLVAVFSLKSPPIAGFWESLRAPMNIDLGAPLAGLDNLPNVQLGLLVNVLIGVLASLFVAQTVRSVLARSRKPAGAHHH